VTTQAPKPRSSYARHRDRVGTAQREQSRAGRDIGPLPAVVDPARKEAARLDLRRWVDSYFPQDLPWSADHLRVIARAQRSVLEGGQFAIAMPRGSGKTTLAELACLWAVSYGHRSFVVLIGATEADAVDRLDTTMGRIESDGPFADDFPEVCYPIQELEGIAHRCAGQLLDGERTQITWTQNEVVLPTVPGSPASGAVFKVAGIEGRIRGMKFQRPDGKSVRPDLVVIDDPQTDASAQSVSQCATRERILAGAVLGLAGPGKRIAALMPCTVIRPGDVADNLLDRQKHPEWSGERCKLAYQLPTNSKLWDRYGEIRAESLRMHGDLRDATAFYVANRAEMDAGAVVAWEQRFLPGEVSAIQHAMNLKLQDEASFWAEFQNQPLAATGVQDEGILSADQIAQKLNGLPFGVVPLGATHLTAFIDVQQKLLYWGVFAWEDETFTGSAIAYSAWPDQKREYFTLHDAQITLSQQAPGAGVEAAILAGLEKLTNALLSTDWKREDGSPMRISLCMVDASWGPLTETVYTFCRRSDHATVLMPSHGRFVGPSARPFHEWTKKPGDRIGPGWHIPASKGRREKQHILYDANHWKTFVHSRLAVPHGDAGSLTLFGREPAKHRMLAEHLVSERRERMQGTARVVDVWKLAVGGRDNHLFDCFVGAAVGASTLGVRLRGLEAAGQATKKRRILFRDRGAG